MYVQNDLEDCEEAVATCITVPDCEDFDSDGDGWRDQVRFGVVVINQTNPDSLSPMTKVFAGN